ncbi:MAG: DUF6541 family protein [Microbacterium sp.]
MIDALSAWPAAAPAFLAAAAVVLVPGLIAVAPLRVGLVPRVALAGVAGVLSIGAAGVLAGFAGIGFSAWQPVMVAIPIAVVVWLAARGLGAAPAQATDLRRRWVVLAWAGAVAVIALVAFAGVPSPDRISQTYDNVFHMSAIAAILDHGDASSLTLRTLIETDRAFAFYPSGWHSIVVLAVQLTGASIPVAVNATWLAVCAVVWLPGVAWLAQACIRRHPPRVVAAIALPIGAAFPAMPYALLSWGTLYPTFLATALLPAAVAIPVAGWWVLRSSRPGRRLRVAIVAAIGVLAAVGAISFAQPRVLATWALLVIPGILGVMISGFRRGWRAGGRDRRRAVGWASAGVIAFVVVAAGGFAYVVVRLGLFERPLDDRLGGPQATATQSVLEGIWQVLSQSALTGIPGITTWPSLLLAVAVLVGAVVAARARGIRWLVVGYALLALLFALAAGSDDVVSKLATALWYKDRFRLSSALPVIGVVFATLGIIAIATWIRRRTRRAAEGAGRLRPAALIAGSWIVTVTSALVIGMTGSTAAIAAAFHLPPSHADREVVSQAQIDFFARLGDFVPEDQRVLGSPWDGSAWTLLLGDREPVFPHVNGQWDHDRHVVAGYLELIEEDPAICVALDNLRVRYVLFNPHALAGGDPAGDLFPGPHAAVGDGLFTEVASDGETTLYRVDQCGPLPGGASE